MRKQDTFHRKAGIILFLFILFLQGCGGAYRAQESWLEYEGLKEVLKARHTESPGGKDPLSAIKELTPETAISIALRHNPSLSSIRERIKESLERYPQAVALDDPHLNVGLYPEGSAYRVGISQRWPFPGKLSLRGELVLKKVEEGLEGLEVAKLELIYMIRVSFSELIYVERAMEIVDEERRLLKELKESVTTMYEEGGVGLEDVLSIETKLARIEHQRIILERRQNTLRAKLNTLIGRPAGAGLPELRPPSLTPITSDIDALMNIALENNPRIKKARRELEGAEADLRLTGLKYYPDFTVTAGYNTAWMDEDLRPFIGVGINIPIGTRVGAEIREKRARLNSINDSLRAVVDQIEEELTSLRERLLELEHAKRLFEERLILVAELTLKTALTSYREGRGDFTTLMDSERELFQLRLEYERILTETLITIAGLNKILGKER